MDKIVKRTTQELFLGVADCNLRTTDFYHPPVTNEEGDALEPDQCSYFTTSDHKIIRKPIKEKDTAKMAITVILSFVRTLQYRRRGST